MYRITFLKLSDCKTYAIGDIKNSSVVTAIDNLKFWEFIPDLKELEVNVRSFILISKFSDAHKQIEYTLYMEKINEKVMVGFSGFVNEETYMTMLSKIGFGSNGIFEFDDFKDLYLGLDSKWVLIGSCLNKN